MWNFKKLISEAESKTVVAWGWGRGQRGEMMVKGYKFLSD
jgi:hypothetical protein